MNHPTLAVFGAAQDLTGRSGDRSWIWATEIRVCAANLAFVGESQTVARDQVLSSPCNTLLLERIVYCHCDPGWARKTLFSGDAIDRVDNIRR